MKKNFVLKFFVLVLLVGILVSTLTGCSTTQQAPNNESLHPLGLATLYETGIPMAEPMYNERAILRSSIDLTSQFPPVGNQGSLGSCVGWATGYANKTYQEQWDRAWGVNTTSHQFSPAYIYNQIHLSETADGGGAYFSDAFNLLVSQGCTTLSDMPYNGSSYGYRTLPTAQQKANAAAYKAASWSQLPSGDYNEIRYRVYYGNPVVIGIPVYPDFDNLNSSNPIYDNWSGTSRGGHALCIVGFDDAKYAVKIINSWGTSWGIGGYGWISYNLIYSLGLQSYVLND